MKAPSRRRRLPLRFLGVKRTEPKRSVSTGWFKKEQQGLLRGLSEQGRLNSDLDLLKLQKKVPKRSLLEIQNLLKFLKLSVVRRVHAQVQTQKREEHGTKAPVEIWTELAQKIAGVHEETISSAFSQMLVIAATEPLSRLHSVPPRPFDTPRPDNLRTTHDANRTSSPFGKPQGASSIPSTKENPEGAQPSSVACQASAQLSTPIVPKSNLSQTSVSQSKTVPNVIPPVPAPSAATVSLPSNAKQSTKRHARGSVEKALTVDFDKIYKFLSNINTNKGKLGLTAMESAVLLDLLMSLPEELPLLDCKELQHHLLQVHTRLTSVSVLSAVQRPAAAKPAEVDQPAQDTVTTLEIQRSQPAAANIVQKGGHSCAVSEPRNATEMVEDISNQTTATNPPKDQLNWATAGLFPLNPFMLPITLLKRHIP